MFNVHTKIQETFNLTFLCLKELYKLFKLPAYRLYLIYIIVEKYAIVRGIIINNFKFINNRYRNDMV